ncbi:DUF6221 family protein [Nonomuraea sp. NPDC059194]|uniref:DUF6221 family protein n=1 Tax=Nonomuraea sp. NPDC059194 TaxID=3346764 RepID=UPI00368F9AC2
MDDLIAFLRARLDEDETLAQAAISALGAADGNPGWPDYETFRTPALDTAEEYLERFQPARVLREVEAKRRLVELHLPEPLSETDRQLFGFTLKCAGESWVCYGDGEDIVPWPCDHLKLLALPYADHPEYRADWQPSTES